jgi:type VI secretion system secreted protein VgrG
VLTSWAGEAYGACFLPRIGEMVVVDFFDGDIDRPFVLGRIHEGARVPTKFDIKGQLPDTKQLSGIRSKELAGSGFGQLRFDDTTGQISSQLQSSHGASQLNLGQLSYPKENESSQDRGEGFELRTDRWGAIRAGEGLLLSTHKQEQAQGQHLNATTAKQQLSACQSQTKALNDIAKHQQTHELESIKQLQQFVTQIEDDVAQFNRAILLLSAPESVAVSSNDNIHLSADRQINLGAGESIHLSTQQNLIAQVSNHLSLFAAHDGMKFTAAQGPVELVAQGDRLSLLAKTDLRVMSTEERVEITSPKEILLRASGVELNFG